MGLVISQFTNPWGTPDGNAPGSGGLQPARPDLWQLDLRTAATVFPKFLNIAYAAEADGVNHPATYNQISTALPTPAGATYLARTVQLPRRIMGIGAVVRRDNGAFEAPGYQANVSRVDITFVHELALNYSGSSIWALLTVWRAFARAGMGPDFPGSPDLSFGLLAAAKAVSGSGLNSPYRQDFSVTLLAPSTGATDSETTLAQGPGYVVKNAWPIEFGVEQLSYENGRSVLELRASFQCDDVLPDTALVLPATAFVDVSNVAPSFNPTA